MNNETRKEWLEELPVECNLCHKKLTTIFVDGKTKNSLWAIMCPACYLCNGVGLGIEKGQAYDLKTKRKIMG